MKTVELLRYSGGVVRRTGLRPWLACLLPIAGGAFFRLAEAALYSLMLYFGILSPRELFTGGSLMQTAVWEPSRSYGGWPAGLSGMLPEFGSGSSAAGRRPLRWGRSFSDGRAGAFWPTHCAGEPPFWGAFRRQRSGSAFSYAFATAPVRGSSSLRSTAEPWGRWQ